MMRVTIVSIDEDCDPRIDQFDSIADAIAFVDANPHLEERKRVHIIGDRHEVENHS